MIGVESLAAESLLTVLRPCMVREDNPSSSCIFTGHHLHQDILYCLLCLWTMAWMDIIWLDTVDIILSMCPRPQFQVGNSLHILLQLWSPGCSVPVLSGGGGSQSGLTKYIRHVWSLLQSPALCNSQDYLGTAKTNTTRCTALQSTISTPHWRTSGLPTDQNNSPLIRSNAQNCTLVHILS